MTVHSSRCSGILPRHSHAKAASTPHPAVFLSLFRPMQTPQETAWILRFSYFDTLRRTQPRGLSSSTNNANIQCVAQITPGFTPKEIKPGVLFLYARNKPSNELKFHRLTPRLCLRGRPISSRNRSMRCLNHRTKSTPSRSSVKCSSVSFSWPKATDVFSAGNLRSNSSE